MTEQQPRRETDPLTGIVTREEWRKGGKLDRDDGPAFTLRDDQTGTVIREEWYKDGHQIEPPSDGARR
jgi:hypothetical protein